MQQKQINIVQVEAKDIVNAGSEGYQVKSLRRYKGTFDYSLEWIKLKYEAERILRRKSIVFNSDNQSDEKVYTDVLVSVTFKYKTEELGRSALREKLYKEGFVLDGKKYVRFKRSSGSSRVGKCLFIREELFNTMMKWSYMGLNFKDEESMDLASVEAYIALTTSSIIDTLDIKPHQILVIDDYESEFEDDAIVTRIGSDNMLVTGRETVKIKNSIWDGQSLMDSSLFFEKYRDKGMLLLRNRFFKSCCFNCNIQSYFKDMGVTDVSQLKGYTRATKIEDIKLITTPSSIKYLKFGSIDDYFDRIESTFGIVKYDKKTHFMGGELVQSHYQLLNTLEMSRKETENFLEDTLNYIRLLKTNLPVLRYQLKMNINSDFKVGDFSSSNDFVYTMLNVNDEIEKTNVFNEFRKDLINNYVKNVRAGHVLVNGNYSVLMGNGLEMLKASIGMFDGTSSLPIGTIMNKNFKYNTKLLGVRSPHVTMGNLWVIENLYVYEIDKYFNLSKQILCMNSIGENVLERLNGCDFDSDQVLLTDNEMLIKKAEENYDLFLVPTSKVESKKTKRYNTAWHKYDLDEKTSVNKIGEIINLSQVLNSHLWELKKQGLPIDDVYNDICKLAVMSCIEIDRAKKEFVVNNTDELKLLREKYSFLIKEKPMFFYHLPKDEQMKACDSVDKYRNYETTMDYLEEILTTRMKGIRQNKIVKIEIKDLLNADKVDMTTANKRQVKYIIEKCNEFKSKSQLIWMDEHTSSQEKYFTYLEEKKKYMDCLSKVKLSPATMTKLIHKLDSRNQRRMLEILYLSHKETFLELLEKQLEDIETIKRKKHGELQIYGKSFIFCKNSRNLHH